MYVLPILPVKDVLKSYLNTRTQIDFTLTGNVPTSVSAERSSLLVIIVSATPNHHCNHAHNS